MNTSSAGCAILSRSAVQRGRKRCLLTAVQKGMSGADIADMIVTAATDHFYLDGGHVVDFINKAFELLDRIGWDHADRILPSLVNRLCTATP